MQDHNSQSNRTLSFRAAWPIYAGALAYLLLRTPRALTHGYVYAEEGTVYLRYAWDAPVLRALLAPHQSYYSLYANLCTLLAARAFPLEWAALFLVWSSIAIQMLLAYTLVQCERFPGFKHKALAVAVCLSTVPTMNVALSTINAQFFLAIAAGTILISDTGRLQTRRACVLFFASLNGVVSCVLLPLFLLRAWQERTTVRMAQAGLLGAGTLIQVMVVLHMIRVQARTVIPHSTLKFVMGAFLINGPIAQFLTRWSGNIGCREMLSPRFQRWDNERWFAAESAAGLCIAIWLWIVWKGGLATRLLGAMAALSLIVSLSGALPANVQLMCGSGGRYFFLLNAFAGLGLILLAQERTQGRTALFARILVVCLLLSGWIDAGFGTRYVYVADWSQEVSLWRRDPQHKLRIAPEFWPAVTLAPQHDNANLPVWIYDSNTSRYVER